MASVDLRDKIRTISYGIFIPTFFIIIGAQTDITIFSGVEGSYVLVSVIVIGSIFSKFVSGIVGGKLAGFSLQHSLLFASSSIPQLSTTLAVVFTALSLGLIEEELGAAMVILSIVTTLISLALIALFGKNVAVALKNETLDGQ